MCFTVPRIREIGHLRVYIRYLTFSFKKNCNNVNQWFWWGVKDDIMKQFWWEYKIKRHLFTIKLIGRSKAVSLVYPYTMTIQAC